MVRWISVLLLSAVLGTAACGTDNVGACKALVEDTKCGDQDAGDKLNCSAYASTQCDIKPFFDCLKSAYVCVNGHYDVQKLINASACAPLSKCVVGAQGNLDFSTSGGPTLDFSTTGNPDFSTTGNPDFSGGSGGSCGDIITCANACTTQACETSCISAGTLPARSAYNALGACIDSACPSSPATTWTSSNPCGYNTTTGALLNTTACNSCVSTAQMSGGSCAAALQTCSTT